MTVLVYGDRSISSVGNMKWGELLENYLNTTRNARGIYYPDPRLILLDGSDFYDVAQDEFNCFDKKDPECPANNVDVVTFLIVSIITGFIIIHQVFSSEKGDKDIGCKVVDTKNL